MSIFSQNIYENIRTRTIVLSGGCLLLHPPRKESEDGELGVWRLPGGGLEPHESLAECARREVFEETGIVVQVGPILFLREWIVPRYTNAIEPGGEYGYGLEVFHLATPEAPVSDPIPEQPGGLAARWIPLAEVPCLALWPKELKACCRHLSEGQTLPGCSSFIGSLESPWEEADPTLFFRTALA